MDNRILQQRLDRLRNMMQVGSGYNVKQRLSGIHEALGEILAEMPDDPQPKAGEAAPQERSPGMTSAAFAGEPALPPVPESDGE